MNWFPEYNFILASKSERRQQLLHSLGIEFEIRECDVEETYPGTLDAHEIPVYLAELKARSLLPGLKDGDLLITADTIVSLNGCIMGKPEDAASAGTILRSLSGNEHQVITGVCLSTVTKQKSFYAVTNVQFKHLSDEEINFYIHSFRPFDKAGAYGIQEWIGYIGISHIEGSFYNVMGLPLNKLYEEILAF